jgi:hypothetical protein
MWSGSLGATRAGLQARVSQIEPGHPDLTTNIKEREWGHGVPCHGPLRGSECARRNCLLGQVRVNEEYRQRWIDLFVLMLDHVIQSVDYVLILSPFRRLDSVMAHVE